MSATPKKPLRHMVVLIPGITGSALVRDGRELWGLSGGALWTALRTRGDSLRGLELGDPARDDGVVATRLVPGAHIVPGLVRVDGYAALRQHVEDAFEIVRDGQGRPLNLVEFPYDWRRDNRIAARQLGELVAERLRAWRGASGAGDAEAIVLAHSMGGLVARYWIECLDGWRSCRALITLGTPHRGAPHTVGYLAGGYKKLAIDLTCAMRSFPSVHQLLPRYASLHVDGAFVRVAEAPEPVPGVNRELALDGIAFHREIEQAVARNDRSHGSGRCMLLAFAGTGQPTIQSASLTDRRVQVSDRIPPGVDPLLADGDGTVPRASAIPIEQSDDHRDAFVPERHGSLQSNVRVLSDIRERIVQLQVRGLGAVRAAPVASDGSSPPAIALDVADAYVDAEPVTIGARVTGDVPPHGPPHGTLAPVDGAAPVRTAPFAPDGAGGWRWRVEDLPDGLYRLDVKLAGGGSWAPPAVRELFGVARAGGS